MKFSFMRTTRKISWALSVALLVTMPNIGAAYASPVNCIVNSTSKAGGRISVVLISNAPDIPFAPHGPQISWNPPTTGSKIDLTVGYQGGSLAHLKKPSGAHAQFLVPKGADASRASVVVESRGVHPISFSGTELELGTNETGQAAAAVNFDRDTPKGGRVVALIASGKKLRIRVLWSAQSGGVELFNTSKIEARDRLLAEAQSAMQAPKPGTCTPTA